MFSSFLALFQTAPWKCTAMLCCNWLHQSVDLKYVTLYWCIYVSRIFYSFMKQNSVMDKSYEPFVLYNIYNWFHCTYFATHGMLPCTCTNVKSSVFLLFQSWKRKEVLFPYASLVYYCVDNHPLRRLWWFALEVNYLCLWCLNVV